MLADETVERVRKEPDIVQIIGGYVKLNKRGRNHLGLCPFHSEKSPSFTVSPEKRIWHCFGCHESGDLISFVQKVDHLSFVEAIKTIAHQANIEVIEVNQPQVLSPYDQKRKLILDLLGEAKVFFQQHLMSNPQALAYWKERQFSEKTIEQWQLGYAPSQFKWQDMLPQFSRYKDVLPESGIAVETESKSWVSRFRHRAMVPIVDHNSRTVGFGGRLIDDQPNMAKYMNSNENNVFNKRRLLFGLNRAKNAIKKMGHAILMEGYVDVIMAHQFGLVQTIGSMGTALTNEQVKLLARYTDTIYLALDNDNAGRQAMERGYEVLKAHQFKVMVIQYDEKDPADCLISHGVDYFQQKINTAQSIIESLIHGVLSKNSGISSEMIPRVIDQLVPFLRQEKNTIILNKYVTTISQKFGIDSQLVLAKIQKSRYTKIPSRIGQNVQAKNKYERAEEWIILSAAISLEHRNHIRSLISQSDFITESSSHIYDLISHSEAVNHELLDSFNNTELKSKLGEILVKGEKNDTISQSIIEKCCATLKGFKTKQRIDEIKNMLRSSSNALDDDSQRSLLAELQQLRQTNLEEVNGKPKSGESHDYSG